MVQFLARRRNFQNMYTDYGAHPAQYLIKNSDFPRVKSVSPKMIIRHHHHHLAKSLRMQGAVIPLHIFNICGSEHHAL